MSTQKYVVKSLSVGNGGNKIFRSGDIVTEKDFVGTAFKWAVDGGFIIPHNAAPAMKTTVVFPAVFPGEKPQEPKASEVPAAEEPKAIETPKESAKQGSNKTNKTNAKK